MTNDTKAPERIWAGNWLADCGETDWGIGEWRDEKWPTVEVVGYIRHDLHLSLVAEAYEDAGGKCVDYYRDVSSNETGPIMAELDMQSDYIERRILSLTPTDAQVALDARDKQIKEEALREALKIIHDEGWIGDTHNRIVALIEKEQTDE